ncbi:MAG: alpha amylase C-terminal domain-containing protein, partial [Bacillota bacterium]|nr:alpha amylase C-terminal domain-containing protein [Bacillota bacterium]
NNELYEIDFSYDGFEWIDHRNNDNSVIVYMRKNLKGEFLIITLNFTPELINDYRIGVPESGNYKEIFNSDKGKYGGANNINRGNILSEEIPFHGFLQSIEFIVPPLGISVLRIKKGVKK